MKGGIKREKVGEEEERRVSISRMKQRGGGKEEKGSERFQIEMEEKMKNKEERGWKWMQKVE